MTRGQGQGLRRDGRREQRRHDPRRSHAPPAQGRFAPAIRVQRPVAGDLCPLPAGLAAARPGNMFVSHEFMLDVGFAAARARLMNLAHGDWLSTASRGAYADGLTGLIRVGPLGAVPGACKLVRVSLLEPVPREDTVTLPLRWEATGIMGGLFPVLDADLTLTPVGAGTLMRLDGAYRPPLAGVGAGLDRVVLHRAATAAGHRPADLGLTRSGCPVLARRARSDGSRRLPAGITRTTSRRTSCGWVMTCTGCAAMASRDCPVIIERTGGLVVAGPSGVPAGPVVFYRAGPRRRPRIRNPARVTAASWPAACAPAGDRLRRLERARPGLREHPCLVRLLLRAGGAGGSKPLCTAPEFPAGAAVTKLPYSDPSGRAAHIACGAALFNLRLAAAVAGQGADVRLLPDPREPLLLATVRLAGPYRAAPADSELHAAIDRRHTNRQPFSSRPVPPGVLAGLSQAASLEHAILHTLDHDEAVRVLNLAAGAERAQLADPGYRAELARWAGGQRDRDGIPDSALGPRSPRQPHAGQGLHSRAAVTACPLRLVRGHPAAGRAVHALRQPGRLAARRAGAAARAADRHRPRDSHLPAHPAAGN